ncbi:tRNA-5-carboxymethylaminomethyl-2-thiouridine(34)synthesis protein MnmE [hydrothermal vent metagenome]|uniref:tRNA-5-carboxymethylaminomethyl-2-thiouridine(34) synthesis protein MnmE n=1 Tax=hydrothermal vent metagenome TaxID=652676 RepID=A0A3B0RG46_9ZZZZ
MDFIETIAAVATAPGQGGVGIIRISGPLALQTGLIIFTPARAISMPESQRLYYGDISASGKGGFLDKGYFVFMKGPNSFTGEDVVELHCHGGPFLLEKILEGVLQAGKEGKDGKGAVRLAEPGEFTKRAFLNGKMDLSEAEAVAEVIGATNDSALAMASSRLQGRLALEIGEIKEGLVEVVTRVEAELDFAEEEIDGLSGEDLLVEIKRAESRIRALIRGYAEAAAQLRGVKVVITGRPNTGKSSLLNLLLKEERAIVTPLAGTTRDVIEESVVIQGLPARLMDTAGLRHGDGESIVDEVEAIGIERARARVSEARVVFFVVDGSEQGHSADIELLQSLTGSSDGKVKDDLNGAAAKKSFIIVANKSDKVASLCSDIFSQDAFYQGSKIPVVAVSALKGAGIEALEGAFFKAVTGYDYSGKKAAAQGEAFITTLREKDALTRALSSLEQSEEAAAAKVARECLALELRGALDALGEVVGETTSEDILNRIFSSFCIGK